METISPRPLYFKGRELFLFARGIGLASRSTPIMLSNCSRACVVCEGYRLP